MKILIVGVGALGSSLVSMLVPDLKGEHEITILDKDNVEERNVQAGTQFYTPDQIGIPKVEALQFNVYKWYQREIGIINKDFVKQFHGTTVSDLYDLIIDCFDNYAARLAVGFQTRRGSPILHVGFSDQFTFAIEWAENYKVPSDITSGFDICESEGAASFIKMVASLASQTIQDYIKTGQKREFIGSSLNIREIK